MGWAYGAFYVAKTFDILREHFFCPRIEKRDVENLVASFLDYRHAKSSSLPHGSSIPLLVPNAP